MMDSVGMSTAGNTDTLNCLYFMHYVTNFNMSYLIDLEHF